MSTPGKELRMDLYREASRVIELCDPPGNANPSSDAAAASGGKYAIGLFSSL